MGLRPNDIAEVYLVTAIRMGPWANEANLYIYTARTFFRQGNIKISELSYQEGIKKYPRQSGKIWDDTAITHGRMGSFLEAAYRSHGAHLLGNCRRDVMQHLHNQALAKLSPDPKAELERRKKAFPALIEQVERQARDARAKNTPFLTPEFAAFIRDFTIGEGTQEAAVDPWAAKPPGSNPSPPAQPPGPALPVETPPPAPPPPAADHDASGREEAKAWITSRLKMAENYQRYDQEGKARAICEEIIEKYPKHPLTHRAHALLKQLKK